MYRVIIFLCFYVFAVLPYGFTQCIDYGEFDGNVCDICAPTGWTPINATEIDTIGHYNLMGGCTWLSFPGESPTGGTVVSLNVGNEGIETTLTGLVIGQTYSFGIWWLSPTLECNGSLVVCCTDLLITLNGEQYIFEDGADDAWVLAEFCFDAESTEIDVSITGIQNGMQGQIVLDDAWCSQINANCCELFLDVEDEVTVCPETDVPLILSYTGETGSPSINWYSDPPNGISFLDDINALNPIFNYTTSDPDFAGIQYVFTAVVEDDLCIKERKITVDVLPYDPFTFAFDGTKICEDNGTFIFPPLTEEGYSGTWAVDEILAADHVGSVYTNIFTPNPQDVTCPIEREFSIEVEPVVINTFNFPLQYCRWDQLEIELPFFSEQGNMGAWTPDPIIVEEHPDGFITVEFSPDNPYCNSNVEAYIEIVSGEDLTFTLPNSFCKDDDRYILPFQSDLGIQGYWSEPSLDLNTVGNFTATFYPDDIGCFVPYVFSYAIKEGIDPTFNLPQSLCKSFGEVTLDSTSLDGIVGAWNIPVFNPDTIGVDTLFLFWTPDLTLNPCANSYKDTIIISQGITPVFSLPDSLCKSDDILTLPLTSNQGVSGSWSIPTIDPFVVADSVLSVFTPDSTSCASNHIYKVYLQQPTIPVFDLDTTLCELDDPLTLPDTSINGVFGVWSNPIIDPALFSNQEVNSFFLPDSLNQCATPSDVKISVAAATDPSFNIPTLFCWDNDDYILPLTSIENVVGSWDVPSLEISNNSGNNISATFMPAIGTCANTNELTVEILSPFDNSLSVENPSSCLINNGQIQVLGGVDQREFSIDGGQTWTVQNTFDFLSPGNYVILIRSANLLDCQLELTAQLTSVGAPVISNVDVTNVTNCSDQFGSIVVEAVGNSLEYSIDGGVTWQISPEFYNLLPNSYTILVVDSNSPDCITQGVYTISDFPGTSISSVSPMNPSDCGENDGIITIVANGQNLEYSIDGGLSFYDNATFYNLGSGFYEVVVRSKDAFDCIVRQPVNLISPNLPSINAVEYDEQAYCEPTNVEFSIVANGDMLEYSIDHGLTWQTSNTFNDLTAGLYTILARETLQPQCIDSMVYDLVIDIAPPISFDPLIEVTDCPEVHNGSIIVNNAQGGFGNFTYSIDGVNYQQENTFINLSPAQYTVFVVDQEGCLDSMFVEVLANSGIHINLENLVVIDSGELITIDPKINAMEIDSFAWSPTDGLIDPFSLIAQASPSSNTIYTLTIFYGECSDNSSIEVEVVKREVEPEPEPLDSDIVLSNVFSPNGDGFNDFFFIQSNTNVKVFSFQIYNRWGNKVFSINNPQVNEYTDGWNGKCNGSGVGNGVFVYSIEYELNGERKTKLGSVTIVQ